MKKVEFHISADNAGRRIDVQTSELSGLTRSRIQRLIEKDMLAVNDHAVKPNYRTKAGDTVSLFIPDEEMQLIPEELQVPLLYKDDFLIIVDKPPGMVVYPAAGHASGTLMNAIAFYSNKLASVGGPLRPGVVHRLDKDTSGVMVIALDDRSYYDLAEQFRQRSITRKYIAAVYGSLKHNRGEIFLKIGRSSSDRKKMSTKARRAKEAVTAWEVIERLPGSTIIQVQLGTGRTHQIRVHLASIGHPVLGDRTYGKKTFIEVKRRRISFPRQMLHADLLGFTHPVREHYMEFISPLPADMKEKIDELREA